ncbi:MAG: carboxypeptidase regulatory-like domain-containing protein [Acidobacteria bacterium]|nr:carboxypeptidase regulatory-like domain-containing protein [Acidobacteriota bacterium]
MAKKLVSILALALLFSVAGLAQRDRGVITGIVTDSTGAVVPSVQLTITHIDTNAVYKAATTEAGAYTVPNLPVGPYRIGFEAAGFKKVDRGGIQLSQGQVLRVDLVLEVGSISDSVQVTAEVSRVETDTPRVASTMASRQVTNLPVSFLTIAHRARTVEDWIYKILPGVSGDLHTSAFNGIGGTWGYTGKLTLFDGAPAGQNGVITESSPSMEAVGEFQVLTAGYSAEYGRIANGVLSYAMKSGSNDIHGSAYGQLRNEALNSNTFGNKFFGRKRDLDRKHVYAFSFGGPVYLPKVYNGKDKTFFYATYEKYNQHMTGPGVPNAAYPLKEFYEGDFSRLLTGPVRGTDALGRDILQGMIYDPSTLRQLSSGRWVGEMFPGNRIPASRISKVSQNVNKIGLQRYLPTYKDPNTGLFPLTQNANWPGITQLSNFDQYQFDVKLDRNISSAHKFSGSYGYNLRAVLEPRSGGLWDWSDPNGGPWAQHFYQNMNTHRVRLSEDWTITPRLYNRFSANWNRQNNPPGDRNDGVDGAAVYGIKNLKITNYPRLEWGGGPIYPLSFPQPFFAYSASGYEWGYSDVLSFSKGRHFMKAGYEKWHFFNTGAVYKGSSSATFTFSSAATTIPNEQQIGAYTGYSFATYLLGIVTSGALGIPAPRTPRSVYHAGFFQDDFKLRPNLTLNLGLRWDFAPPAVESFDRQANWDPTVNDPLVNLPGAYVFAGNCNGCNGKRHFGKRDLNNFGPRIGFAWQARKEFTVRGAYTITYVGEGSALGPDIVGNGTNNLSADPVNPWKGIFNWDDGMPANIFVAPSRNPSYADTVGGATMLDPRYLTMPYVQQWNLNVQKQLPWKILLDVGYIGNKSTKLWTGGLVRLNQTPASVISRYGADLPRAVASLADAARYGVPYPYPGFSGTVNSALRQFPQLRANNTVGVSAPPEGMANYHSLNVVADRRFHRGLSVFANWTWGKVINNTDSTMVDYYNRGLEKLIFSNDAPHRAKMMIQYDLPVGRGKAFGAAMPRALDCVFGGWEVSLISNYFSGTPLGFGGAPGISGWNGSANRLNVAPGEMRLPDGVDKKSFDYANRLSKPRSNNYFNTSLFSVPAALTVGSAAPRFAQLRGWGVISEDLGLRKQFRFREKYTAVLRAEMLNAPNRHYLPGPNTSITSPYFGYMTGEPSGNRLVQAGLRLDF